MNIHNNMGNIIRKNIHSKNDSVSKTNKILIFIKKRRIVTTSEISKEMGLSWNTAEKRLLEVALEGKIIKIKKEGVNLWILKK
jgi:Mn-dependent DtxR family transcriptional regulator